MTKRAQTLNLIDPLTQIWVWRRLAPDAALQAVRCLLLICYAMSHPDPQLTKEARPLCREVQHALDDLQESLMRYPHYWRSFSRLQASLRRTLGPIQCEIHLHSKNDLVGSGRIGHSGATARVPHETHVPPHTPGVSVPL